jgi:hypothetical protein
MPKIIIQTKSPFLSTNKKTRFSVELQQCPLMRLVRTDTGAGEKMTSPKCAGCYAAVNMNVRPTIRKKIVNLPAHSDENLENFKLDLHILKGLQVNRLRFYSWTDFSGPSDLLYIQAVLDMGIEAQILSKTLTMPHNETSLVSLFNKKGVILSLSFNKDWTKNLPRIKELLKKHKPENVQLNYTLNVKDEEATEEMRQTFQVFHIKNNNKRSLTEEVGIPETQVCGVFDENGERCEKGGSCLSCKNCDLSFISAQKGKTAELPDRLIA